MKPKRHIATDQLEFHSSMSDIHRAQRACSNSLSGSLSEWQHISNWNGAQEADNSQPGWDFIVACQQFKSSPEGIQLLTSWIGFHGSMSAIKMEPNMHTDLTFWMKIYGGQQLKWSSEGTEQLTNWMKFHISISAIQIEPKRHTATHFLNGISYTSAI